MNYIALLEDDTDNAVSLGLIKLLTKCFEVVKLYTLPPLN